MEERAPISVVIPTLNAEATLPAALAALAPSAIGGLIREVVVADGGSDDRTQAICEAAGARLIRGAKGRGAQLAMGADAARGRWFLFLHADTVLGESFEDEAAAHLARGEESAGVFTLRFDRAGLAPRLVAAGAMIRTRLLASPYGDQGLLISRTLYERIGGFRPMTLFEDVDIIDRLVRRAGRRALRILKTDATTSAARYVRDGYVSRVAKNACCLAMFRLGVPTDRIEAFYR